MRPALPRGSSTAELLDAPPFQTEARLDRVDRLVGQEFLADPLDATGNLNRKLMQNLPSGLLLRFLRCCLLLGGCFLFGFLLGYQLAWLFDLLPGY